jgi:hypothetical protein
VQQLAGAINSGEVYQRLGHRLVSRRFGITP